MAIKSEIASYDKICNECCKVYAIGSRSQDGPFHFMIVTSSVQPDNRVQVVGLWRSGDWVTGQTLYLLRRDGHHVPIINAEMLPALNQAARTADSEFFSQATSPSATWVSLGAPRRFLRELTAGHIEGT